VRSVFPPALALAALAAVPGASSASTDASHLRPGLFLYASPALQDPNFAETVVLLVKHDPEGSMGLVVNRPTRVPLSEALAQVRGLRALELSLHWGGPVEPEAMLALVRTPRSVAAAVAVLPGVYLTGDLDDVRAGLAGRDPSGRVRVYAGYTGWGEGQLAAEVRGGYWVLDEADAATVFSEDTSELWYRVHRLLRRLQARLAPS
jgi:putative transcriptional regulator